METNLHTLPNQISGYADWAIVTIAFIGCGRMPKCHHSNICIFISVGRTYYI